MAFSHPMILNPSFKLLADKVIGLLCYDRLKLVAFVIKSILRHKFSLMNSFFEVEDFIWNRRKVSSTEMKHFIRNRWKNRINSESKSFLRPLIDAWEI